MTSALPHDLLRVADTTPLTRGGPVWLQPALLAAPWVVVRRARCADEGIPVGIRGATRSHRHAAVVEPGNIVEILTPADLLGRIDRLPDLPAVRTLHGAAELLAGTGMRWGPGGSVGFALATGARAISADSDLDLVIRADRLPAMGTLIELDAAFRALPARVDCLLELPAGSVALTEVVGGAGSVLMRTPDGPRLTNAAQLAS